MRRGIGLALVLAAAIWLVWSRYTSQKSEEGQYYGTVEAKSVQVGAKAGGRVAEVLVEEGQTVQPGQLLVRFESNEVRALREQAAARVQEAEAALQKARSGYRREEVAQAEAAVAQAESQLAVLREGARPQELEQARQELAAAEAERNQAERTRQRLESLRQSGDVSQQQGDEARAKAEAATARRRAVAERVRLLEAGSRIAEVKAAEARVRQMQQQAALFRAGNRPEDVAQAQARLAQAEAQLQELEVRVRDAEVKAPAEALVESLAVRPGDLVAAGRPVATLREAGQLWVRIYLPETELERVKLHDAVFVQADTKGEERWWRGEVSYIASQGEFLPRNVQTKEDRNHLVFAIRVKVAEAGHPFKPGMSASLRFAARQGGK